MNYLPFEILQEIFSQLHQIDKVECLTVCRAWRRVLEETTLFQVVRIRSNTQMQKLITQMDQKPNQRQKVKQLILDQRTCDYGHISDPLSFFSNIEEITVNSYADMIIDRLTDFPLILAWSKTIKRINEEYSHVFSYIILKGGVCPLLTELTACGKYRGNVGIFFDLLGNAPALKVLILRNYKMTLVDIDLLHERVPLLSSLSLEHIDINPDIISTNITPTNSIMKLCVNTIRPFSTERYIALLTYLAKKYARTSEIVYSIDVDRGANFEEYMTQGLVPHLQQVAPFLASWKVSTPQCFQYIFPTLDQNNCQLKEFVCCKPTNRDEMYQIVYSSQARSIQKFTIYLAETRRLIDHLSKLEALTELNITFRTLGVPGYHCSIYMNNLLEKIESTSTSLKLVHVRILPINISSVSTCHNLKNLTLQESIIPEIMDHYISQAFPNLRKLIIKHCTWKPSVFYLNNLNLFYLELVDSFSDYNKYVLVETLSNKEKRYYFTKKKLKREEGPNANVSGVITIKSSPFLKRKKSPKVTFVCNSLCSFMMVNIYY